MLLQMGLLLHLGPVITLVPSTHLPARFLKVKSHRFSCFHRPGYFMICQDASAEFGLSMCGKKDFLQLSIRRYDANGEEVNQTLLKESIEKLKDLHQQTETYQVGQPILTKLTRHCRTRWFFFSSFFLLSSLSSIRSLSLIAT